MPPLEAVVIEPLDWVIMPIEPVPVPSVPVTLTLPPEEVITDDVPDTFTP